MRYYVCNLLYTRPRPRRNFRTPRSPSSSARRKEAYACPVRESGSSWLPGKRLMTICNLHLSLRISRSAGHISETTPRLLARSTGDTLLQAQPGSPMLNGQYVAGTLLWTGAEAKLHTSLRCRCCAWGRRGPATARTAPHCTAQHRTWAVCLCVCVCLDTCSVMGLSFFLFLFCFCFSPIRHVAALLRQKVAVDVGTTILSAADHGDLSLRRPIPAHSLVIVRVVP